MDRDHVGGVDNGSLNHESTRDLSNASNSPPLPKRPRTENPSTSTAIGESSNSRGGALFSLEDPDLLDCPICTEPLHPPVYQCINGHLACALCCTKIQNKCPSCTLPISSIRCRAIEKVVESIMTSCVYLQYGCNEKILYLDKSGHEATCKYIPYVPCVNGQYGCNNILSCLEKQEHEQTCQYIPIMCPHNECGYLGEPKSVYNHHAQEHPEACHLITFESVSELSFQLHLSSILLRERDERILFSVRRMVTPIGSFVCVRCIAPPTLLDMKFSYKLIIRGGEECMFLKSNMQLEPDWSEDINIEECYLIPHKFHSEIPNGLSMQVVISREL